MDRCVLLPTRALGSGGRNPNLLIELYFLSYCKFKNYMIRYLFLLFISKLSPDPRAEDKVQYNTLLYICGGGMSATLYL